MMMMWSSNDSDIVHLMSRDDEGAVFRHVVGDDLTELALRWDVETIGRLVHQKKAVPVASAKLMNTFFFCPIESSFNLREWVNQNP